MRVFDCEICEKVFENSNKQRDHKSKVHNDFEAAGARKSIVLFAAQNTEENYSNLALAMNEIELDKIDYKASADLKCQNIINGLQNHSSKYPCGYGK